jgi:hypothetical protein
LLLTCAFILASNALTKFRLASQTKTNRATTLLLQTYLTMPAKATASKASASKKSSPPEHPPYKEMIKEAILAVCFSSQ